MNPIIGRRAALEMSLASLLSASHRPGSALWPVAQTGGAAAFDVTTFGARGDGAADDSEAFRAAIGAAGKARGTVLIPPCSNRYLLRSTLELIPNITLQGAGASSPTLHFAGGASTALSFHGDQEAKGLNVTIANLSLETSTPRTGTAISVRNFRGLTLHHLDINHFQTGISASWGIGLYILGCNLALNGRALEAGGEGDGGGIRVGRRALDPYLDTIVVEDCAFAQNTIDINDIGSTRSLGGLVVRSNSFFEAYASPVTDKGRYISVANRKGIAVYGNWFEGGQPSRVCIHLGDHDPDGRLVGPCYGAAIFANHFLQTASPQGCGVEVAAASATVIYGNCFEFADQNQPIRFGESANGNTVGDNAFLTYPSGAPFPNPVTGGRGRLNLLDPSRPMTFGAEVQVMGRLLSTVATPAFAQAQQTDAAAGNYFIIGVTDPAGMNMQRPSSPERGQSITYDIRNETSGTVRSITWDPTFLLAGPFVYPGPGRRRTISFYYDGSHWIETGRSMADI